MSVKLILYVTNPTAAISNIYQELFKQNTTISLNELKIVVYIHFFFLLFIGSRDDIFVCVVNIELDIQSERLKE